MALSQETKAHKPAAGFLFRGLPSRASLICGLPDGLDSDSHDSQQRPFWLEVMGGEI